MAGLPAKSEKVKHKNLSQALFVISYLVSGPLHAASTPEHLVHELKNAKAALTNDEIKQRKILGALFHISRKMKKIVIEKADLEQQKLHIEGNVKELAQQISGLENKTKHQKALLRDRLAAIYKLGGQGVARLLFSSSSSAELERNLKILGIVAVKDVTLIKDYSRSKQELARRKENFTRRWAHLKKIDRQIAAQEKNLLAENAVKTKILEKIQKSQKVSLRKIGKIRRQSRGIARSDDSGLLDLLFQPSFFEQKGQLPPPVQGRMVQGFGLIKNEAHKVVLSHKGQFYSAELGSPVKAIFNGTVAFADEVPGFGKTLILDHGDHYYSVYSHTRNLQVTTGEEVKQFQVLAQVGDAGASQGSGIYFEVRHFSEPADPKVWMKGTDL